ncbi:MAG: hypothetical protein F6K62_10980 [Sphaerospermopsis sp. SIO1G2]|nr:hypothetical protein [Sphaerospermopsis sp. SIO1G2]
MDLHTNDTTRIFNESMVMTPPIVTLFTMLRRGTTALNELNYPELSCIVSPKELHLGRDAASKLTAALSIHIDGFLGLSCAEGYGDTGEQVMFTARFSNLMTPFDVDQIIKQRAADIIDTLMAIC